MLGAIGVLGAISFGGYIQPNLNDDVRSEFLFAAVSVAAVIPVLMLLGLWGKAVKEGKPKGQAPLLFGLCTGLLFLGGDGRRRARAVLEARPAGLASTSWASSTWSCWRACSPPSVAWCSGGRSCGAAASPTARPAASPCSASWASASIAVPDIILGFLDWPLGQVDFSLDQENLGKFLNAVSFIGYVLLLVVLLAFVLLALRFFGKKGEPVDDDPWDGQTLEWATSSPPPADEDFAQWVGEVTSPEPLLDRKAARAAEVPAEVSV